MTARIGRPPKLNEAKWDQLIDQVADGLPLSEAAAEAGVSLRTVQRRAERDPAFARRLRDAVDDHGSNEPRSVDASTKVASAWATEVLCSELLASWASEPAGPHGGPPPRG